MILSSYDLVLLWYGQNARKKQTSETNKEKQEKKKKNQWPCCTMSLACLWPAFFEWPQGTRFICQVVNMALVTHKKTISGPVRIVLNPITVRADYNLTYFRYYMTNFCSFHLEISHCDAPRANSSSSHTTVTNLQVKTVADRMVLDVKPRLEVEGLIMVWKL